MTLSAPGQPEISVTDAVHIPAEGSGLTLLRLGLWTEEMRLKTKMMAMVVDDARGELACHNDKLSNN